MNAFDKFRIDPPGAFLWFFCFFVGANAWKVTDPNDQASIIKTGLAMILTGCWQAFSFAYMGHVALAPEGGLRADIIVFGVVAAIFIMTVDSLLFIEPSFVHQGMAELRRGGLEIKVAIGERIRTALLWLGRAVMACAIVQMGTYAVTSLLFSADSNQMLMVEYQQANAPVFASVQEQVQQPIDANEASRLTAVAALTALRQQEPKLRATAVDPQAADADIARLFSRIADLEGAKREADVALAEAETFAANELAGIRGAPGNTGKVGDGPVRRAARERVEAAGRQVEQAGAALAAARTELQAAQQSAQESAAQKSGAAESALEAIARQRLALEADIAALEAEGKALRASREERVAALVGASPDHVPLETGLLAQVGTMGKLAEDPAKLTLMIILEIVFFTVELGAILSRSGALNPSPYARQRAYEEYLAMVSAAKDLGDALDDLGQPRRPRDPPRGGGGIGALFGDVIPPTAHNQNEAAEFQHGDGTNDNFPATVNSTGAVEKRPRGRPKGSKIGTVRYDSVFPFYLPPPRKGRSGS